MAQAGLVVLRGPFHLGVQRRLCLVKGGLGAWRGHTHRFLDSTGKGAASQQEGVVTQDPGGGFPATTYLWVLGCPPLLSAQGGLEWLHKLQGEKTGLRQAVILELER